MNEITYTKDELDEFDLLTAKLSSQNQMDRIEARLDCRQFLGRHGREKCDAMFAELTARDGV